MTKTDMDDCSGAIDSRAVTGKCRWSSVLPRRVTSVKEGVCFVRNLQRFRPLL